MEQHFPGLTHAEKDALAAYARSGGIQEHAPENSGLTQVDQHIDIAMIEQRRLEFVRYLEGHGRITDQCEYAGSGFADGQLALARQERLAASKDTVRFLGMSMLMSTAIIGGEYILRQGHVDAEVLVGTIAMAGLLGVGPGIVAIKEARRQHIGFKQVLDGAADILRGLFKESPAHDAVSAR